jgi:hypothetical protein
MRSHFSPVFSGLLSTAIWAVVWILRGNKFSLSGFVELVYKGESEGSQLHTSVDWIVAD